VKIMIWNAAPGGMRSVVDGYVADGFVARHDFRLIASYGEGGFWVRQWLLVKALFAYLRLLATARVELVHIHAAMRGSFWRKAIFAVIARRFGVPVVLHLHGSEMKDFYAAQSAPVKRLIGGQLEAAACVLVLSQSWQRFVAGIAPRARIVVAPNFVDIPATPPGRARSGRVILFLGLVGERKGVFDLLEALALARAEHDDLELIVGGAGAIERARVEARRLGVADSVEFLGWVGPQEREALFRRADIFALPSRNEGLPMSVLEAMARGLPVIATPVGGVPELIDDGVNGILVPPGDAQALARAIARLASDPAARAALGAAARQTILARHSAAVVLPGVEAAYAQAKRATRRGRSRARPAGF
jgi:glycosyltransferase involved in cell wall biosynthesis